MKAESIDSLLARVAGRNSVLFLGAGFSADGVFNTLDRPIPGSSGLSEQLLDAIGEPISPGEPSGLLADVADYCFRDDETRAKSVQRLRAVLSVKSLTEWQLKLLTQPPWKRIYTTNYDNAIELAFASTGRSASNVSAMTKYSRPVTGVLSCIHVNGMIGRIDPNNVEYELRLSNASYSNQSFVGSEWSALLASDLAYSDCIVFVGFSMSDLDVTRLVVASQVKDRVIFFNGLSINKFAEAKLTAYGHVERQSGSHLTNRLLAELKSSQTDQKKTLRHFHRVTIPDSPATANDLDRYSLLLFGQSRPDLLLQPTKANSLGFAFDRAHLPSVRRDLENGSDVSILGSLGNGKSLFLEQLGIEMTRVGWRVISCLDTSQGALAEVEQICAYTGPQVILLDEVTNSLRLLERFALYRSKTTRLAIADRTMRYDRVLDREKLEQLHLEPDSITEYVFDELSSDEIGALIRLLDASSLWGEQRKLEPHQKRAFLERRCRSELGIVLLSVSKSPDLKKRIQATITEDGLNHNRQAALICVCALKVFGFSVSTHTASRLVGSGQVEGLLRSKSEIVARLIDTSGGRINVHSSVFASFLLRDLLSPELVLDVLATMVENAHRNSIHFQLEETGEFTNEKSRTAAELYVFRNLQQIIKSEDSFELIYAFYERIREKCELHDQALYWLQYAIAKLFSKDLEAARRYLDSAYGAAKRSGLSPYQIDNQYSRYLLETTVVTGNSEAAYDAFAEAHRILLDQAISGSHLHYPFRCALNYHDFISLHRHAFSDAQKEFVKTALAAILSRAQVAMVPVEKQHWVDKCIKRLSATLRSL
jgi:hypothetical protein